MPTTITLDGDVAEFFKEQSRLLNKPLSRSQTKRYAATCPLAFRKKRSRQSFVSNRSKAGSPRGWTLPN